MKVVVKTDAKNWNKKTKRKYEQVVKMMAAELARSINSNPVKYGASNAKN